MNPHDWAVANLNELVENHDGRRVPVKAEDRKKMVGPYPYYGASGVIDSVNEYLFDGEYLLIAEDGANLLSRSTPIAFQAKGKFWVNNHAHIVKAHEGVSQKYIEHYLNATPLDSYVTGSAQPKLTQQALNRIPIALPPFAEQRRIVEKIEALTARSRRAREALDALPALIDRYRQSILAAAFRGDLTAKDQGNDRRDLEPGEGPYPIPREWKWLAMQDLVSSGPQNGLYLPKNKYGAGHPILRIDNFQDYSSGTAVDFKKVDLSNLEREVYGLSVDDIVINRVNAPSHLGKCMVVSERHVPAVFESNMMRLRVIDGVPARYVAYFLKSRAGRKALLSNAKWAVNQASINQGDVLATPVPLPTDLGEMQEIVDCIESALAKIEAFGAGVESTFDRLSTLDQSILAKAFRGELVPQDPNDEPASVLLERIRAERAAAGEKPRRGRRA